MPFDCPAWPPDWPQIAAAVQSCLQSGEWGQYHSEVCSALEQRLSHTFQASTSRLCCSGTAALEIALRAAKIGLGDEVVVAAFDYPGNFRTIELLGATPVLVDVAEDSPCLDPSQLDQVESEKVRAVVASHLFGSAAAIKQLRRDCDDRGWILIEDACQVAGMEIDGRPVGSFGHLATVSFGGSKLISAGNGGALLVNSTRLAARIGPLLDRPGETFPLGPLQAAVIGPQLDRLSEMNQLRNQTARFIEQELNPQLPRWKWHSGSNEQVTPAFYKVAWTAQSAEARNRIITAADRHRIPIGDGFRSMSRCSERRCRKPISTPRADELGERLFLLDHRALLIEPSRYEELADCLRQIHDPN
jgi:dTDP-4-amino-4,6-dideoxygalactose transaminase